MASKGGVGLDIDVSRVPLREEDMEPFEIMVSESQERMLCVVEPERVAAVIDVCEKWETLATPIGCVTDTGQVRVLDQGVPVGDLPVEVLVDDCPLYDLDPVQPARAAALYPAPQAVLAGSESPAEILLELLRSPNIASRRPVFEQYDPIVQSRTVRRPDEADAAVLMLPGGGALGVSIDGSGRRVACDPRVGAAEAVYECSANLACVGAEPLGLTNCLNFGNPEKSHVAWQLTEAVDGMAEACEALGVPVVGGNVSLYNEAPTGPIFPTPVVGMVGRLPDAERAGRLGFVAEGDVLALVGYFEHSLAGSELAKLRGEEPVGSLPVLDGGLLRDLHAAVRDAVRAGALGSCHDIAEGGLVVALAECCLAGNLGVSVELGAVGERGLFGEAPGCAFLISGPAGRLEAAGLPRLRMIGRVGGDRLWLKAGELELNLAVSDMRVARDGGLAKLV
jgi:phosphoribosylformylglycinamidine synthase